MDELKIKSKFTKRLISMFIENKIARKYGEKVTINIEDVDFVIDDDRYGHFHIDLNGIAPENLITQIVKEASEK